MAVGISGAAFTALCCIAPFIVAGLITALGLGFILDDSILIGLLVVFIGVAALGYYFVRRQTSRDLKTTLGPTQEEK